MPDQTTPPEAAAGSGGDPPAGVHEELAAAQAEIARLRGRLVEINEELGEARGELEVTRARSRRLSGVLLAIWLRIPVLKRIPDLVVRRLRARRGQR
jgi:hypothetical protein